MDFMVDVHVKPQIPTREPGSAHRDHVVRIHLRRLEDLVSDPDVDPFQDSPAPEQAGVLDLAATLTARRHLPRELIVQAVLPTGASPMVSTAQAEAALHRRARYLASVSRRESMTVRSMGRRQLPLGILFYVFSAAVAYGFAYVAQQATGAALLALFTVLAALAMTVAWVVSWMVVESSLFDWRPAARTAAAYELLERAELDVVLE